MGKKRKGTKHGRNTGKPSSAKQLFATDPITGSHVYTDSVQVGGWGYVPRSSGEYELELSHNKIIYTERHFNYPAAPSENRSDVSRLVLSGKYSYSNGVASGTTDRVTLFTYDSVNGVGHESASSSRLNKPNTNPLDFTALQGASNSLDYSFTRIEGQIDRSQLNGLTDSQYYPAGWWNEPFAPNLV